MSNGGGFREPPVQVIPPGLLGFLQIKNLGKNPQSLGGQILPTMDLLEWYFQSNMEQLRSTLTIGDGVVGPVPWTTGSGATVNLTTSQDEFWWVESLMFRCTTFIVAGEQIQWQAGYRTPALNNNFVICGDRQDTVGAAAPSIEAYCYAKRFFMPPGSEIVSFLSHFNTPVGGGACECYIRFVRLPL